MPKKEKEHSKWYDDEKHIPPTQKKKRKRERVRIERCYDESAARGRRKSNKKSSHQWLIIEQWVDFHFGKILMSWLPLEKHSKTKLEEIERQFMLIEETMITSGGPKRPWVEEKLQEPLMYKKPWLQLSNEEKKKQCCVHFTGFSWINQISNKEYNFAGRSKSSQPHPLESNSRPLLHENKEHLVPEYHEI